MKTERMQEALGLLEELTKFGMNLGLERIRALLAEFNNPHLSLPVIHLAGTNGKGSTAAMLAAVLDQCGYRVGMFTSPHLVSYTERFTIDGAPISEEDFAALLHEVHGKFQQIQERIGESPTEFETLTAMAFLYFARQKVDILLLEAGLGGDIDSTIVVERPLLSIITNVSLEHTQYLGKSSAEIAARKSGIIKKNRPVITAAAQEEVLQVIRGKAEEQESALFEVYREMTWQLIEETPDGQYFAVCGPGYDYGKLFLPLRGDHQLANAATALLALEVLMRLGWIIPLEDVRRGLACTFWPGRLEKVSRAPLIVLDGAHNPAGMQVLAAWLKKQRPRYRRVILLIGMLADKDRISSVQFLNNLADSIIITRPPSVRADHWEELAGYFDQPGQEIVQIEGWQEALKRAREQLGPEDLLLITGSLYLIGAVRASLLSSG